MTDRQRRRQNAGSPSFEYTNYAGGRLPVPAGCRLQSFTAIHLDRQDDDRRHDSSRSSDNVNIRTDEIPYAAAVEMYTPIATGRAPPTLCHHADPKHEVRTEARAVSNIIDRWQRGREDRLRELWWTADKQHTGHLLRYKAVYLGASMRDGRRGIMCASKDFGTVVKPDGIRIRR
ncbi:hypothetical protein P171DRAFT_488538 [Karstenula rhodostoma CBS 690.94]|uniref:Uncharacterized protein n=1 Tax=Karstenula rhodostoma CBS 690.94 TaxID=1392251 RepID=A0A9P4U885_9PLEO|nr:hypothetical protein P171DRAFT_488538 [Karstenula rhodostoma CBS 690.94]